MSDNCCSIVICNMQMPDACMCINVDVDVHVFVLLYITAVVVYYMCIMVYMQLLIDGLLVMKLMYYGCNCMCLIKSCISQYNMYSILG